jgi:hypothetical protein
MGQRLHATGNTTERRADRVVRIFDHFSGTIILVFAPSIGNHGPTTNLLKELNRLDNASREIRSCCEAHLAKRHVPFRIIE